MRLRRKRVKWPSAGRECPLPIIAARLGSLGAEISKRIETERILRDRTLHSRTE